MDNGQPPAVCQAATLWLASLKSQGIAVRHRAQLWCRPPRPRRIKRDPPLTDRWWYPLYEKMVELDVPAMVHVSASCNANFHATGAHYLNADTTAFMQFLTSDLFKDFPILRFIIPHGGGAVPYHWGRYRGLAQDMKRPPLGELLLDNVYFDTCVYHQPGIDLLW